MNGSSGDGLLNNQRTAYHHHQVEGKWTLFEKRMRSNGELRGVVEGDNNKKK